MPTHSTASGTELHEDKRIKEPVRAASTATLTLTAPGATIDGITMVSGDRFLAKDQSTASQNGLYVWNGAASTATRTTDADASTDFILGFLVFVREGTANGGRYWTYTTDGTVTVGSTSLAFASTGTSGTAGATGATGAAGATGATGLSGPAGSFVVSGAPAYVNVQDQKAQNTQGGTFTTGADRTRTLNTITSDSSGIASLASDQVTLPAGTYTTHITAPVNACNFHQAWLYNATSGAVELRGGSEFSTSGGHSHIRGTIALRVASALEVRHRCSATRATDGFGTAANFGVEVYTVAEFWLVGGPPPFFGSTQTTGLPAHIHARRESSQSQVARGRLVNALFNLVSAEVPHVGEPGPVSRMNLP